MRKFIIIVFIITIILLIITTQKNATVCYFLKLNKYIRYSKHRFTNENMYNLFNIENISSKNFNKYDTINAYKKSINEYIILDLSDKKQLMTNIINNYNQELNLKKFIESILPNVNLNGEPININNCVVVDLMINSLQPFPSFHTDIEWNFFSDSNGFQVWYLYENDDDVGNMFIADTEYVKHSSSFFIDKDKKANVVSQCSDKLIKKYNDYRDMNLNVKYLDMKGGECFIFGQNTYHKSDHRKSKYRKSVNFRVILKDDDGGIPINNTNSCPYNKFLKYKIRSRNIREENNKIYPDFFDLATIYK